MDDNRPPISGPASGSSIITLVLNVVIPGLGTIIGGRTGLGVGQLALFLVGIPLLFVFGLGALFMIAAWIWGVITGVQMMSASTQGGPPGGTATGGFH